ncbi:hypothetical protein B0H14DRAFT_2584541 [Mycena olivaceomarginata]|nr:hypothetical protein B0H14DRAFT_2584541 [Mycena olivaceomarginata]
MVELGSAGKNSRVNELLASLRNCRLSTILLAVAQPTRAALLQAGFSPESEVLGRLSPESIIRDISASRPECDFEGLLPQDRALVGGHEIFGRVGECRKWGSRTFGKENAEMSGKAAVLSVEAVNGGGRKRALPYYRLQVPLKFSVYTTYTFALPLFPEPQSSQLVPARQPPFSVARPINLRTSQMSASMGAFPQ